MRSLGVAFALTALALAGCASEAPPADEDVGTALAGPASHPAYGFLTSSDLQVGNLSDFPSPGQWNGTNPPGPQAWKLPAYRELPAVLRTIDFGARTTDVVGGGHGIAVFGPVAIAGGSGASGPMNIINIMDPLNPHVVGTVESPVRDADTILYPDGRLVVVSSSGGRAMTFTDITDPHAPEVIAQIETPHGNHNLAVVPGSPIVYNSPSSGTFTDIIDASDPDHPVVIKEWENGHGCHDMTFYINATQDKMRGYCAGIDNVQIWDVADATDPQIVADWGWPAFGQHDFGAVSLLTFAHLAIPNHDASVLILGDETGGGAAPGCDFSVHEPTTGTTVTGPLGNLWFYDITDETRPVLKGSVSPSAHEQRGSCTAHFGRVIEDTDHIVVGFYSAGVALVDFTDAQNPYIKHRYERPLPVSEAEGAGTIWDVWYHQGYLLTGDTANGVDVLTLS